MKLINNTKDLLTSLKLDAKSSLPIRNFQIDSRKVQKNSVFLGSTVQIKMGAFMQTMRLQKEHPLQL